MREPRPRRTGPAKECAAAGQHPEFLLHQAAGSTRMLVDEPPTKAWSQAIRTPVHIIGLISIAGQRLRQRPILVALWCRGRFPIAGTLSQTSNWARLYPLSIKPFRQTWRFPRRKFNL